jgi:hypothetical protein
VLGFLVRRVREQQPLEQVGVEHVDAHRRQRTSGLPGMWSGVSDFSTKRVTRFHSVTVRTPNSFASSIGTSTTPTVMSAPFSTW